MKTYLLSILSLLLCASLASAQSRSSSDTGRLVSVVAFEGGGDLTALYWWDDKLKLSKIEKRKLNVAHGAIAPPSLYKGGKALVLGSLTTGVDGKPSFTPLAKVNIPLVKHVVVLLYENEAGKELPFTGVAFDASMDKVPMGGRLLVNFSDMPIRGIHGKDLKKVKAQGNRPFQIKPKGMKAIAAVDSNAAPLTGHRAYVEAYDKSDEQWKRFVSQRWYYTPNRRNYVFFYNRRGSSVPVMRVISGLPSEHIKASKTNSTKSGTLNS